MDWFERLTGFRESGWNETRDRLQVEGRTLRSRVNGRTYGIGELKLVSLAELRERMAEGVRSPGRFTCSDIVGDVRALHRDPAYAGALFQVASQFNLLEMTGPTITPEHGVTGYANDHTQGPACAIAAGAATLYRNYFAPVGGESGQRAHRQLDGLADLGAALAGALERPIGSLWEMRNGYALCTNDGLAAIGEHLSRLTEDGRDHLRGLLRIGVHRDVEVTDDLATPGQTVSQAFCSALPVAYVGHPREVWAPFATLVLEAAYEATLLAGALNSRHGASDLVFLTRVGGGAFGNEPAWIDMAIERAMRKARPYGLDVRMVTYG